MRLTERADVASSADEVGRARRFVGDVGVGPACDIAPSCIARLFAERAAHNDIRELGPVAVNIIPRIRDRKQNAAFASGVLGTRVALNVFFSRVQEVAGGAYGAAGGAHVAVVARRARVTKRRSRGFAVFALLAWCAFRGADARKFPSGT